jgi:outer membrane protein TolC
LREQLLQLVEAQQQVEAHRTALQVVVGQYAPSLDKTNFKQMMQEAMDEAPRE